MGEWVSNSFIAGLVALVASWVLTGCLGIRFGNHVEYPKNPDQISGYYQTEPYSLKFCSQHDTLLCNDNVAVSKMPEAITSVFSNPVALIVSNLSTGEGYLAHSSGKGDALPTRVKGNNTIFFLGKTDPLPVWGKQACTSQLSLLEEGSFYRYPEINFREGQLPLHGAMELKLMITTEFQGKCTEALSLLFACSIDVNKCGGESQWDNEELHAAVQSLFQDYFDAGVMEPADILTLKSLAIEVLYK